MATINSQKLYRRDAEHLNRQKKDILRLTSFKLSVANALIKRGKTQTGKRGRPLFKVQNSNPKRSRCGPEDIICFDKIKHFSVFEEKRSRCKNSKCAGKTRFICKKCKVNLCETIVSNCFSAYHGE